MSSDRRVIGRWYIGDTLGKGGYSWVKKGEDVKTKKIVALKFMEKADSSWLKEQAEQVETEIGSLKNIRHKNVMKLYAYNLNAQYPTKEKTFVETILLVLEYAPGGELFDILYYTGKLPAPIARSYFHQIINGLQACHDAKVVHRDLKPQNLLLDGKYNLKITDFGLSKVMKGDSDQKMKTYYVGTRGYQAPELLIQKGYDKKCDVFSIGVILFILLCGYPPFEEASKDDKWFKPLTQGLYDKFWKAHQKSPAFKDPDAKALIQSMLEFDPSKRASISDIKESKWYKGQILKQQDLIRAIKAYHQKAELKRQQDIKKQNDLKTSINASRAIKDLDTSTIDEYNPVYHFGAFVRTYGDSKKWMDIYNFIQEHIQVRLKPPNKADYSFKDKQLNVFTKVSGKEYKFYVKVYADKTYGEKPSEASSLEQDTHIFAVDIRLVEGDLIYWNKVKANLLVQWAAHLKGLPKWALEKEKANSGTDDQKENEEAVENEDEDYDKLMKDMYCGDKETKFCFNQQNSTSANSNATVAD